MKRTLLLTVVMTLATGCFPGKKLSKEEEIRLLGRSRFGAMYVQLQGSSSVALSEADSVDFLNCLTTLRQADCSSFGNRVVTILFQSGRNPVELRVKVGDEIILVELDGACFRCEHERDEVSLRNWIQKFTKSDSTI